jgi:enoyl-CoA hydratase|uniref:Crotonase n=1 Tax=candidate division WOR-3 bacterium TaxID=2052148 RepID=A0A7C3UQ87_UNCW3
MGFKNLVLEVKEGIGILQINRPQVLNALNTETLKEMEEALLFVKEKEEIKALIITGSGRAFIAGADISEMVNFNPFQAKEFAERGHRILGMIENLPKVVIAAINGFALGGGCELALACDIRIMAEGAKIGQPETNIGLIPGFGGCLRLPRVVGKGIASELIFTGEMIDATEALRIGLVNKVTPKDKLLDISLEIARKITSKVPETIALGKRTIKTGLETDLETAKEIEIQSFSLLFSLSEPKEKMKAFLSRSKGG